LPLIGGSAFEHDPLLATANIPASVTSIGSFAFNYDTGLTAINVDPSNTVYSSNAGVLFDKAQTVLIQYPGGRFGNYTVPNGVITISDNAFAYSDAVTGVTMPASVTSLATSVFLDCGNLASVSFGNPNLAIGEGDFENCYNLKSLYFAGNAPVVGYSAFAGDSGETAYYLPGTTGWSTFTASAGPAVAQWNVQTGNGSPSFGYNGSEFGFGVTGSPNLLFILEVTTNPASGWTPHLTNTIPVSGLYYYTDPQTPILPHRLYRLRTP
jgi:hypothetical protein